MYEGARVDVSGEAVIFGQGDLDSSMLFNKVFITAVDSKSSQDLGALLIGQYHPYPQKVFVKPGRHAVSVKYAHLNMYAEGELVLEAEAGKSYLVTATPQGYGVSFYIKNIESGEVVGGINWDQKI